MALETATYIDGLVATNPAASDAINTADDHLRLIKSTIKATFPNLTGPVTKTQTEINGLAPLASPTFTGTPAAPTADAGTNTTQLATTAFVKTAVDAALQAIYPVGSVYVNATNSTNPGTLLGFGTWVAFGAGRVPVGFDSDNSNFNAAEKTGGTQDAIVVSHTHTATVTDPGHKHAIGWQQFTEGGGAGRQYYTPFNSGGGFANNTVNSSTTGITVSNSATGSSGTNANLQPYITVYMWKRTA